MPSIDELIGDTSDLKVEELLEPTETDSDFVTVHFIKDGLIVFGRMRFTGQAISVKVGSVPWNNTLVGDPPKSFLEYSRAEQVRAYGEHYFDEGPWPFDDWEDSEVIEPLKEAGHSDQEARAIASKMRNVAPEVIK